MALAYQFLDKLSPGTPSKRRRMARRTSDPESQHVPEPALISAKVPYHYTLDKLIRTRRQADDVAAQSAPRRVLRHVIRHTRDFDIENCMFTIVDQLVDILQLSIPSSLRDTLTKCARERSMVCRELLRTDIATGKGLLTAVMAGASFGSALGSQ